jgi:RNA recognition motif. (a.k.a. RRM, RBD, or RNP domain)
VMPVFARRHSMYLQLYCPWHAAADVDYCCAQAFMAAAGTIEHAEVAADASGRRRGYGVVKFASKEDAQKAIELLNGHDFEGRPVSIKLDRYG